MILIQIIIILFVIVMTYFVLNRINTHSVRAWKKILLILLGILMIVVVIFPDITNKIASIVGVGRGADLLLYILTLSFIIYTLSSYISKQKEKDTTHRVARKIAIIEANERYGVNKHNTPNIKSKK